MRAAVKFCIKKVLEIRFISSIEMVVEFPFSELNPRDAIRWLLILKFTSPILAFKCPELPPGPDTDKLF